MFPLQGKHPIRGTHGHKDATTNPKIIRKWFTKWPRANVGIACDYTTGPIIIDADKPKQNDEHSADELLDELALPETREARTSPGKRHLYFDPPLTPVPIGRVVRVTQRGVKYAVDILGSNGYVVAPPSTHPDTGRRYKWTRRARIQPLPESVLRLLEEHSKHSGNGNGKRPGLAAPIPTLIQEGERDTVLTSLAGTMRRRNMSEEAILEALRVENDTRVVPPLSDKDLRRIARSIARKPPAGTGENFTDLGNARRFIAQHGDHVRSVSKKRWFIWEDTRWAPDETGRIERMAKDVVRSLYVEAGSLGDSTAREALLKHAHKSEQSPRIGAIVQQACTEPEISIRAATLDADPWKFNVLNGTIDLKTGVLLPHNKADHITKVAPVTYDPEATCPKWRAFLRQIMGGDPELVEYLKRAIGYTLTGDTRQQCFFFMYGLGANGKSTFLKVIRALLGDYAQQAEFSTFLVKRNEGPRHDIARMRGVRFVAAIEASGDKSFDEGVIQQLTGEDTVTARELYDKLFEFQPTHKIFLAANHKPVIKTQTEAMWRRLRLIPFTVIIPHDRRIGKLADKLVKRELPGILNWALEGCAAWQRDGLLEPVAVRKATRGYRDENDILGEFLAQRCVFEESNWVSVGEFYRHFTDWWQESRGPRVQPISPQWFGRLLSERPEITQSKRKHARGWRGVALKQQLG